MKLSALASAFILVSLTSAFAITETDITPAALVGKTLTFAIVNGGSPYPTTGTWTGTFAATGNGFSVANISGDTVPISTTYTAATDGMLTDVALGKFIEGQAPATLSLFILDGVPKYEVFISGVFGVSLNGTFTIGSEPENGPEIDVQQPVNSSLADGTSKKNFGPVQVSKAGVAKKFTIKNIGSTPLKKLALSIDGRNKSDFIVSALKVTKLADGEFTEFKVRFKPSAFGTRKAALHIKSNDKDESPFDIDLIGTGVGIK
jgi:hypothetical protein